MDMRVERPRSAMLQLDHVDACDLFTDESAMPAPRVELRLPREEDAFAQSILQRLELVREFRMQQGREAVRLRVVQRPVQQQVRVGAQSLVAALLPRDRVVTGEPDAKAARVQLVGRDGAVIGLCAF